jgi:hypothetical protein
VGDHGADVRRLQVEEPASTWRKDASTRWRDLEEAEAIGIDIYEKPMSIYMYP